MYYRLTHKKTKIQTKWFRVQRIQYWRICEKYSGDYIVEGREETRSEKQAEQWLDYRTLGAIKRVKLLLSEIGSHPDAPPVSLEIRKGTYGFLDTLESNIRNKSKPKSKP